MFSKKKGSFVAIILICIFNCKTGPKVTHDRFNGSTTFESRQFSAEVLKHGNSVLSLGPIVSGKFYRIIDKNSATTYQLNIAYQNSSENLLILDGDSLPSVTASGKQGKFKVLDATGGNASTLGSDVRWSQEFSLELNHKSALILLKETYFDIRIKTLEIRINQQAIQTLKEIMQMRNN